MVCNHAVCVAGGACQDFAYERWCGCGGVIMQCVCGGRVVVKVTCEEGHVGVQGCFILLFLFFLGHCVQLPGLNGCVHSLKGSANSLRVEGGTTAHSR